MPRLVSSWRAVLGLLLCFYAAMANAQTKAMRAPATVTTPVTISVLDENGVAVSGAQVTVTEPGQQPAHLRTDFAGDCSYTLRQQNPYRLHVEKPGLYATDPSGLCAHRGG